VAGKAGRVSEEGIGSVVAVDRQRRRRRATAAGEPGAARSGRERWFWAVAIVAVAGVIGTLVFGLLWHGQRREASGERAAATVARQFVLALTNFDARTIDADFDRIESFATGDFANQAQSFFGSDIRKAMQQVAASSRGQLHYLFTQSFRGSSASVYAVVDETIINNKFTSPEADELRVELNLVKVRGAWRVSEVTVLQSPPIAGGPLTGPTTSTTTPTTGPSTTGATTP
jgi:hypothetical protein